ncbi:MAG: DUF2798 domain-containing protein [Pseudomonas sp.]|jgi:hypothetical protein|uniref:DUF2798 domain-containing protein n=1 Tax=Pseudomonadaceae TaxID=135621 RepID=UPI0021F4D711|nr:MULTISPECIES: DUF2798 domain-containing protein [Pseudomonas]UYP31715.1 DUF2798 domain-containing protein [Pseudomonas sp. Z8(2022)]
MSDLDSTASRSWKLPARAMPVAFAFYMSGIMAMLMTLVITAANRGIGEGYLQAALSAYSLAMPVAFVCVMLVRPIVLKLVSLTVRAP